MTSKFSVLFLLSPVLFPVLLTGEPSSLWNRDSFARTTDWQSDLRFSGAISLEAVDYPLLHAAVFFATNDVRTSKGLKPLAWSPELERSAWNHARRMAEKNFFSHDDPLDRQRKTPDQRAKRAGVKNPYLAENIATTFGVQYNSGDPVYPLQGGAAGYSLTPRGEPLPNHTYLSLAKALVQQWMDSPGHRANILSNDALQLGTGLFLFYDRDGLVGMPMFTAVQNFQWFESIIPGPVLDPDIYP